MTLKTMTVVVLAAAACGTPGSTPERVRAPTASPPPVPRCAVRITYPQVTLIHQECSDPPQEVVTEVACQSSCTSSGLECGYIVNGLAFPTQQPHSSGYKTYEQCGVNTCPPPGPIGATP